MKMNLTMIAHRLAMAEDNIQSWENLLALIGYSITVG